MSAADVLAAEGPLADILPGFAPRDVQQVLSTAVEAALVQGGTLIAEAGTGVGKSMAYLVPVMRSGQRTVISTATRHLQDQLFQRDVPLARRALGYGEPIALLKGRANYLCHYRLQQVQDERSRLRPVALGELQHIEAWSRHTSDGDIAGVTEIAEDSSIWPRVTSTVENCLGSECPQLAACHVLHARRNAQAAQIVVVNHHLLFADMALKEEGFGEVLPNAEAMILDEAHQLPEIASNFFGEQLSTRQLLGLAQDARIEQLREAHDAGDIAERAAQVDKAARDLRLEFGSERRRAPWHEAPPAVLPALAQLRDALRGLQETLQVNAPRSKGLENCHRRASCTDSAKTPVKKTSAGSKRSRRDSHCAARRSTSPECFRGSCRCPRRLGCLPRQRCRWAAVSSTSVSAWDCTMRRNCNWTVHSTIVVMPCCTCPPIFPTPDHTSTLMRLPRLPGKCWPRAVAVLSFW
jgi:ATP-dependent DNA helicase DinG